MKKIVILCLFFICTFTISFAHNPLSAMYYLEVKEDFGIMNLSLSQAGSHEAIFKNYSDEAISEMSDLEYKKLIVQYVKDNFHLTINGNEVELLDGGVKLGNHQTDLKFVTSELPSTFNTLDVRIDAFKENEHHQTVFSLAFNDKTSKVILNKTNNYTTYVNFVDNEMIANSSQFQMGYLWFILVIPIAFVARKVFPTEKKV